MGLADSAAHGGEGDVGRLDVAVGDAVAVAEGHGGDEVPHDRHGRRLGHGAVPRDHVEQVVGDHDLQLEHDCGYNCAAFSLFRQKLPFLAFPVHIT